LFSFCDVRLLRSERALEEALAKLARLESAPPPVSPVYLLPAEEDQNYRTPAVQKTAAQCNYASPTPKTSSPKLSLRQLRALHARSPFNSDTVGR